MHAAIPSPGRWWLWWALATVVLAWPAIWNGYPLFFYDSMDYVRSGFTGVPSIYRSLPYSLFLALPQQTGTLWAVVLVQAGIGAYVLVELFRALAPQRGIGFFLIALLTLALGTGLPWFASQVMPDFFTAIAVAGLALLLMTPLPPLRRLALTLITLIAISAHASHLPTALGLAVIGPILAWWWRGKVRLHAGWVLGVVLLAALITPVSHYVATGEAYMSRNASIMALARLVRDGEAQRYLAEVCPEADYWLCEFQDQLKAGPNGANDFLWLPTSPFEAMGGWYVWREIEPEARQIVLGTWLAHPFSNLRTALFTWMEQLTRFGTGGGSGIGQDIWAIAPLEDTILSCLPQERERLTQARQYREDLDLTPLANGHQALIALAMVLGLILALRHGRLTHPAVLFFWLVVLATLANAAITGIVSNPDERYQARLVWLFVPALWFLWAARVEKSQAPATR